MPYQPATDKTLQYISGAILGAPGAGKTRLAATASQHCFIMDVDNGAADIERPRWVFPHSAQGYIELKQQIELISRLKPDGNGMLQHPEGFPFNVVVLDSLNAIQDLCGLSIPKQRNKLRWYGDLLDAMLGDVVVPLWQANVNTVAVIHEKILDVDTNRYGDVIEEEISGVETAPEVGFAISGSLSDKIKAWFRFVYHVVRDQSGQRWVLTQPQKIGNRYYFAKDTFHLGEGKQIKFAMSGPEGLPDTDIMARVLAKTSGGVRQAWMDNAVEAARFEVLAVAKEKGIYRQGRQAGDRIMAEIASGQHLTYENYEKLAPQLIERINTYLPQEVRDERIKAVKTAWLQCAIEAGIAERSNLKPDEKAIIVETLGDLNDNINPSKWEEQIEEGCALLRAWTPEGGER